MAWGKGVMTNGTTGRRRKNKANLRGEQLATGIGRGAIAALETWAGRPCHVVRNKANWAARWKRAKSRRQQELR